MRFISKVVLCAALLTGVWGTLHAMAPADRKVALTRASAPATIPPSIAPLPPSVVTAAPPPAVQSSTAIAPAATEEEPVVSGLERAKVARMPVIQAIRRDYKTARERYDGMREALSLSGPTNEHWVHSAPRVFESWDRALGALGPGIDPNTISCFVAGCEVHVTFPDMATYERAAAAFRGIQDVDADHGGRVQTPPVLLPNGQVQAAWMMLRPDVAPPG